MGVARTPAAPVDPVAGRVEDLTPAWVGAALGTDVAAVDAERVGSGQIGESYRLRLRYGARGAGPATLVAKLAGGDEAARQRVSGGYVKEVGFYTELAATLDVRTPRCWYGAISDDTTSFTLLLDDIADARPGVQADGCTPAQAAGAVANLVGLHAPRWNDRALLDVEFLTPADPDTAAFLGAVLAPATEQFVDRFAGQLDAADVATLRACAEAIVAWQLAWPEPFTVVHGDYRLDNLMFPLVGEGVTVLDWQTVTVAPPTRDVAYLLGTSLVVDDRRRHEEALVAGYHAGLVDRGVAYGADDCFDGYRLGQLQGPMITVLGCIYATAERSERADGMFLAMATRSCAAIRDLRSLDLL